MVWREDHESERTTGGRCAVGGGGRRHRRGRSSAVIDVDRAGGVDSAMFTGNGLTGCDAGRSDGRVVTATVDLIADHPALLPWLAIFLLPALHSLRRGTSAAGRLLVGAASPGNAPSRTEGHR